MTNAHRNISAPGGFTLVELMVAMVIGLILMAGVIQLFLSSKQNYRLQEGLSRLQENGRVAVDVLSFTLRHAGYKSDGLAADDMAFPADTAVYPPAGVSFMAVGQIVTGTENNGNGADAILNGTDTISFRFHESINSPPGAALIDCLSVQPNPGQVTINTLYVQAQEQALHCRSENGAGDDQVVANGVENMQLLYGVDTDGNGIANQYGTATDVANGDDWRRVVSVRIALLLNTVERVTSGTDTSTYNLLGVMAGPFNDGLLRHMFITTVALRNQLP